MKLKPIMKDGIDRSHYRYIWIFPIYLVLFFLEENLIRDRFFVSHIFLDDYIPFCEYFIIPYCLWYPLLIGVGVYLLFKDPYGFKRYMTFIGVSFYTAVAIYAIVPSMQDLRPTVFVHDNVLTKCIQFLYTIDTNTNVCPSLHVVGAMAAAFGIFDSPRLKSYHLLRTITAAVCVLVSCSTVFIKQHSCLDVIVAVPYAFVCYFIVYHGIFKKCPVAPRQTIRAS